MQGHIPQESWKKKYWISAGLFYPILHILQTLNQVISIFFVHYKMLWMTKISQDQVKRFVENLLSLSPAEFCLKGINKIPEKCQEVIKNNGKYTIDWN